MRRTLCLAFGSFPLLVAKTPAQAGLTFVLAGDFAGSVTDMAVGDVNEDGHPDAVVGNTAGVDLHLGDGAGAFLPAVTLPTPIGTGALALADINHDCHLDIVSAHAGAAMASVLLGDGDGGFVPTSTFAVDPVPRILLLRDLNGDGTPDVLTLSTGANRLQVQLGNGDGTFTLLDSYPTGGSPEDLAVLDLDGDGDLDAVIAKDSSGSTSAEFTNNGSGVLTRTLCDSYYRGFSVIPHDFFGTGAGGQFLMLHTLASFGVVRRKGCGEIFTVPNVPSGVRGRSGDLDGDGWDDLFAGNTAYRRVPLQGFTQAATLTGQRVDEVLDIDGDGLDDVVLVGTSGGKVYLNRSSIFDRSPVSGRWYRRTRPKTWEEAEADAIACGGHLATVDSVAETDWLTTTFGPLDFWIGINDVQNEGTFEWSSGAPVGFTNWAPGQPDNFAGADYGALDVDTGWWRDEANAVAYAGLIEIVSDDCDLDGVPDAFEIAAGWETDIDGNGVPDSCSTPNYCTATVNSSGNAASLGATGTTRLWANDLRFSVVSAPAGEFGYFLTSQAQGFLPMFGGSPGNLCLAAPIVRFSQNVLVASGAGTFEFPLDLTALPPGATFDAGDTWYFQCWFRDSAAGQTSNTSDGYCVRFHAGAGPRVGFEQPHRSADEGADALELRLVLSAPSTTDTSIDYVGGGTATVDVDYRFELPSPITIPAGSRCFALPLTVLQDTEIESDETVTVELVQATGALLTAPTTLTLTLRDDD